MAGARHGTSARLIHLYTSGIWRFMKKSAVVTTRLDAETLSSLNILAQRHDRSRAWIVAKAVKHYVEAEQAFFEYIQEGERAISQGEYFTQTEMVDWFDAKKAARAEQA
jgi:predicted transcriptional regulator